MKDVRVLSSDAFRVTNLVDYPGPAEDAVNNLTKINWRLIPLWLGAGHWQMAIDRWLLQKCHAEGYPPVLRFYEWHPIAISLGYHQRHWPHYWHSLQVQNQPVDVVKRPTGGRAVLHDGDLSYSLVVPNQSGRRRETYTNLCQFLIEGWQSLGTTLTFGEAGRGYQRQVGCFESVTAADLVMANGEKLIGSAQAWRGQTVMQQGSMQLQVSQLRSLVFKAGDEIETMKIRLRQMLPPTATVVDALIEAAAWRFNAIFNVQPLTPDEWHQVAQYLEDSAAVSSSLDLSCIEGMNSSAGSLSS